MSYEERRRDLPRLFCRLSADRTRNPVGAARALQVLDLRTRPRGVRRLTRDRLPARGEPITFSPRAHLVRPPQLAASFISQVKVRRAVAQLLYATRTAHPVRLVDAPSRKLGWPPRLWPAILLDRRVHCDDRRARSLRPLTRCLDGKGVTSFVSRLRPVFVSRNVELLLAAPRSVIGKMQLSPEVTLMSPVEFSASQFH